MKKKNTASTEPLVKEALGSVKEILSRAKVAPVSTAQPTFKASPMPVVLSEHHSGGKIAIPAGGCPVTPKGYKHGWPEGAASDDVVKEWAKECYSKGDGVFAPSAVKYWARYYWDINGEDYDRVQDLITQTLG